MSSALAQGTDVPALVLGSGVTLLGTVRRLASTGVPFWAAIDAGDLAHPTRWVTSRNRLQPPDGSGDLAAYLDALPLDRAVVIACTDELALQTAELPAELAERFPSFQPEARTLRLLVDKGEFLRVLEDLRVPHPHTLLIDGPEDLDRIDDEGLASAFIKPRDSQSFHRAYSVKGFRPSHREGFRSLLEGLTAAGHRLMVQDYVPGPASNHYFVDGFCEEGGEIITVLARQRLRMYPPDFGNSTYTVTVPLEETAEAVGSLRRLLKALSYRGIFSAEFKRDASDGSFRILEVNARPWWYIEFAARAGMDVVDLVYRAALGQALVPPPGYQVGRSMVFPYYDVQACRIEHGIVGGLWRFVVDGFGADQPVFSLTDPWPALRHWSERIPRVVGRRLRGLLPTRTEKDG